MTSKTLSLILICLCAVMAFGYWRYKASSRERVLAQVGIIRDLSDSTPGDCVRVMNLAKRALALPETGGGSTIALLTTGSKFTSNEPQNLVQVTVPEIRLVIEGQRRAEQQKNELLATLQQRCLEAQVTNVSPIFQAVKRGVEYLQNIGSKNDPRYLYVQTDGEETENAQIKKALGQAPGTNSKLPVPIDNRGVRVIFCGGAETVGLTTGANNKSYYASKQRSPQRVDRLREVWLSLFTNPELVKFEPFCTSSGNENLTALNNLER